MQAKIVRWLGLITSVMGAGLWLGCGPHEAAPPTGLTVVGRCLSGGKPASGAILLFHRTGATGLPPRAIVSPDGRFAITPEQGLLPGGYVITVEWRDRQPEDQATPAKSLAPEKYQQVATSPWKIQIPSTEKHDLGDHDLRR